MATGVDLFIQGLRSAGSGVQSGVNSFQQGKEFQAREEERKRKREREQELLDARAGFAETELPSIIEQASQDEDFTAQDFAQVSQPAFQKFIETGDRSFLDSLGGVQNILADNQKRQADEAKSQADRAKRSRERKKDQFNFEKDLSKEFNADDTTKRTKIMREATKKVETSAKRATGVGDLSLIFNYMKILDPNSVVRESEFRSAAGARSWIAKMGTDDQGNVVNDNGGIMLPAVLVQAIQKADPKKGGPILLPEQRKQFSDSAAELFDGQLENQASVDQRYIDRSADVDVDPRRIIGRKFASEELEARRKAREESAKTGETEGKAPVEQQEKLASPDQSQAILEQNKKKFSEEYIPQLEAEIGRKLTPEEKAREVIKAMRKAKVQSVVTEQDLVEDFRAEEANSLQNQILAP